jgi:hypothetical protein
MAIMAITTPMIATATTALGNAEGAVVLVVVAVVADVAVTVVVVVVVVVVVGGGERDIVKGMKLGDMDLSQEVSPALPIHTAKATSYVLPGTRFTVSGIGACRGLTNSTIQ